MKNISFDNPYWLLIAIPLLAALLVPYFISVSKDNRSKGWIASLIIHVLIVVSVSLAAAGLVHTTVMTRTKVYVVADVSYSSSRNLDKIDEYIKQIEENLPPNSRLGIVCFGKDAEILTSPGTAVRSVKEANVDDSGTDIAAALDFTSTIFSKGEIKRIILITDGFATFSEGETASAVSRAVANGIKLDAIYLDNNLRDGESEIQISDVSYTKSTYLNHDSTLEILIESTLRKNVTVDLFAKGEGEEEYTKIDSTIFSADVGLNIATFALPTGRSGVFDYKVSLSSSQDTSPHNNNYYFTQNVAGERRVLLITEKYMDRVIIEPMYGQSAIVDSYVISDENTKIPYTVEDLVKYDEIILSNVDIRKIDNIYAFVDSLDLVVSQYGKSLITMGDLSMQNKDDEIFERLEELLPVSFGNADKDSKLYTIVLDISRSMNDTSQFETAKNAAIKLLSILNDEDSVALVTLSGEPKLAQPPAKLADVRQQIEQKIIEAEPTQGTFIGAALKMAYSSMKDLSFEGKQVMLISDGLSFTLEDEDAGDIAEKMFNDGILLSTVNVIREDDNGFLKDLASIGGGEYYFLKDQEEISDLVFSEIADDITDSVVEKQTKVNIESFRDDVLEGILTLPDVYGYVNSKPKLDATMVLSVDYQKSASSTKAVPLYSYRKHGNGRVATFTSSLSGTWLSEWSGSTKNQFFRNVLDTNTPPECIYHPFSITVDYVGNNVSNIEITPSSVNPRAKAKLVLTAPDGSVTNINMAFNLNKYCASVSTEAMGKYKVEIIYTYGELSFESSSYFTRSYEEEYDSFAAYDIVNVYSFMRGVGQISRDGDLDLQNAKTEVDTYEVSFRVPLLIIAVVLFVIDVIIRKFNLKDIKGLFAKIRKEGAK